MSELNSIGEIEKEYKPSSPNLMAGAVIGLLLIAGGAFALYLAINGILETGGNLPVITGRGEKGWSWRAAGLCSLLGILMLIAGVALEIWMWTLISFRVVVGSNGLSISDRRGETIRIWDDIRHVKETQLYERPPVLKGAAKRALPKMMSRSFEVQFHDGEPLAFDGNSLKNHVSLANRIAVETKRRNIPWEVVEEHS